MSKVVHKLRIGRIRPQSSRPTWSDGPSEVPSRVPPERAQLLYFAPRDLLVPRVDRQCIMRFCEAVAELGLEVEAISLDIRMEYDEPTRSRDLQDVYGLRTPFRVTILPSRVRQSRPMRISGAWRATAYGAYAFWQLVVRRRAYRRELTIFYVKNYLMAVALLPVRKLLGPRGVMLFEMHMPPGNGRGVRLRLAVLRRMDGLIPVSRILARELVDEYALATDRVLVAHMGVNLRAVEEVRVEPQEARKRLGLPLDRRLVVYTGKVENMPGSEIDLLVSAAARLQGGVEMIIVGGREDHVELLRERIRSHRIDNVRFIGFVAPADVFPYQMAADVLVTYYPSHLALNKYRASPGKLFEYMASGRPIVTADYEALREALSPGAALFVEKDNPEALARGIEQVLADRALGMRLAAQALADVQAFTWERRADRVYDFALRLAGRPAVNSTTHSPTAA